MRVANKFVENWEFLCICESLERTVLMILMTEMVKRSNSEKVFMIHVMTYDKAMSVPE